MHKNGFYCLIGLVFLSGIFGRMGVWFLDIFGLACGFIWDIANRVLIARILG
jgi:hypothetical protein